MSVFAKIKEKLASKANAKQAADRKKLVSYAALVADLANDRDVDPDVAMGILEAAGKLDDPDSVQADVEYVIQRRADAQLVRRMEESRVKAEANGEAVRKNEQELQAARDRYEELRKTLAAEDAELSRNIQQGQAAMARLIDSCRERDELESLRRSHAESSKELSGLQERAKSLEMTIHELEIKIETASRDSSHVTDVGWTSSARNQVRIKTNELNTLREQIAEAEAVVRRFASSIAEPEKSIVVRALNGEFVPRRQDTPAPVGHVLPGTAHDLTPALPGGPTLRR